MQSSGIQVKIVEKKKCPVHISSIAEITKKKKKKSFSHGIAYDPHL